MGPYTALSPDLSFVLEDAEGVCGYVLAALNSGEFYDRFRREWLPSVGKQYPNPPVAADAEQVSSLGAVYIKFNYNAFGKITCTYPALLLWS